MLGTNGLGFHANEAELWVLLEFVSDGLVVPVDDVRICVDFLEWMDILDVIFGIHVDHCLPRCTIERLVELAFLLCDACNLSLVLSGLRERLEHALVLYVRCVLVLLGVLICLVTNNGLELCKLRPNLFG